MLVPRSWDALFNGLTDATMRESLGDLDADVVVTTTPELLAVVAQLAPADVALVHQEHRASSARVNDLGALLEFAPRADVVVSLTESMSRWLAGRLGGAAPELLVIPNPLPAAAAGPVTARPEDVRHRWPARAGEAVRARGRRVLAHPRAAARLDTADLGRRPARRQPRRPGPQARPRGPGRAAGSTADMAAEWARTSVAVLASKGEGYPLVLQEAMSAGVPAVSYDCPSGPREIITPDVDGLLVPPASKAALAAAMLRIATDDDLRSRLGAAALARSERWDGQVLARRWVSCSATRSPAAPTRSRPAGCCTACVRGRSGTSPTPTAPPASRPPRLVRRRSRR